VLVSGIFYLVKGPGDFYSAVLITAFAIISGPLFLVLYYFVTAHPGNSLNEVPLPEPLLGLRQLFLASFSWGIGSILLGFYVGIFPVLIEIRLGQKPVALFDIAFQFPQFMIALELMFFNALILPVSSRLSILFQNSNFPVYSIGDRALLRSRYRSVVFFALVLAVSTPLLILGLEKLVVVFLGISYLPAIPLIIGFYAATGIGILSLLYRSLLPVYHLDRQYILISIIQVLVAFVLGWFFIDRWGEIGVVFAYLGAEIVSLLAAVGILGKFQLLPYP